KISANGTYKIFAYVTSHDKYLLIADVMRLNAKDRSCLITVKDDCYPAITLLFDPSANTVIGELIQQDVDVFLNPNDNSLTTEGYPAPKRVYIKLSK
ncbi:MAG: hypothetical protein L3J44_08955, partial [Campylobacteraceae bacterium]|nr:hypothetical protein [Campylobacteraceae bacterium]